MNQLFDEAYVRDLEFRLAVAESIIQHLKEDLTNSIEGQRNAIDELIRLRSKLG